MREIKFKAWNAKHCHMMGPAKLSSRFMEGVETGGYVLMQYTGLKDKNGREIYEGDIVLTPQSGYLVVEWNNEVAQWYVNNHKIGFYQGRYDPIVTFPRRKVIGNIYENPELLEAKS